MRKIVAVSSLLILLVILLLSGCAKSPETPPSPNGSAVPNNQEKNNSQSEPLVKIRVTPAAGVPLQDLIGIEGLRMSYEGQSLVGEVTPEQMEVLNQNPLVGKIEERITIEYPPDVLQRGKISAQDEQDAIDSLRSTLNLTGPYIEHEIFKLFDQNEFETLCLRFRLEQDEGAYQKYIDEINSVLSEKTPKIEGVEGSKTAFCTPMNKADLLALQNESWILQISYQRKLPDDVPIYKVLENGTEIQIN